MYLFYCFALIPLIIGLFLWIKFKSIVWQEWLISAAIAFVFAGIFHFAAARGMTDDVETWSGQVNHVQYIPKWKEFYEEAIYKTEHYTETESYTDSNGKRRTRTVRKSRRVFSHYEDRTRWHRDNWFCKTDLGQYFDIDENKFNYFVKQFGLKKAVPGRRTTGERSSRMLEGDPNDYLAVNVNRWIEPVTTTKRFENRIKAAPSVFSFIKVPTNIVVFPYPKNGDPFVSDRLLGVAKGQISQLKFDQLNSELGPRKLVNLVIVGYRDTDSMQAEYQKAAWVGGKKNDLLLLYSLDSRTGKTQWSRVFGWTESELCKRNLEMILLNNPINDDILELIRAEVTQNYTLKDWSKFDYLTIEPRTSHYVWYFILMILTQGGLYWFFHVNEFTKDGGYRNSRFYYGNSIYGRRY